MTLPQVIQVNDQYAIVCQVDRIERWTGKEAFKPLIQWLKLLPNGNWYSVDDYQVPEDVRKLVKEGLKLFEALKSTSVIDPIWCLTNS